VKLWILMASLEDSTFKAHGPLDGLLEAIWLFKKAVTTDQEADPRIQ